jgi:hypothetical protein
MWIRIRNTGKNSTELFVGSDLTLSLILMLIRILPIVFQETSFFPISVVPLSRKTAFLKMDWFVHSERIGQLYSKTF